MNGTTLLTVDVEPDWGAVAGPLAPCEGVRQALPALLGELDRRGIRATFFVVGELAELFAQHVTPGDGHEVGAHGLTHRRLSRLPAAEQLRELVQARARLAAAGFAVEGFRAPFLDMPAGLAERLAQAGYRYDASAGALGPALGRGAHGALGGSGLAAIPGGTLAVLGLPANLTWLRLLDPLGVSLLRRRPAQLSLHLHELLPAAHGLADLPWPLSRLHARGCGPRAWTLLREALDRARRDGCRFLTCSESLTGGAPRAVSAA